MKVYPIQIKSGYNITGDQPKYNKIITNPVSGNVLPANDTYGRALLNFRAGKAKNIRKLAMAAPFQDKLQVAVDSIRPNEVLVVSNNAKKAIELLKGNISKLNFPLKKVISYQVAKLDEVFAVFIEPAEEEFNILNMGEMPLLIKDIFNTQHTLVPGAMEELDLGLKIDTSEGWVEPMGDHAFNEFLEESQDGILPDGSLSKEVLKDYTHLFLTEIDKEKDYTAMVSKYNQEVLADKEKEAATAKNVTFADVGGQDEIIAKMKKFLLYPLKFPNAFKNIMGCCGGILYGPPGTGKTFLAEAFAAEAEASAFKLAAGELSAKYVGESEERCRELFAKAIDGQPSVIFIDEIDALGKSRGGNDVHGDKLLNQFLSCMSNIKDTDRVVVLGTTNRIDTIDPAILRSGRFDLQLEVKAPDLAGTMQILEIKLRNIPLVEGFDKEKIAKLMYAKKMTGADITAMVRNAYINNMERTGIFESMDKGRFTERQMEFFALEEEDFEKAISDFNPADSSANRKPVGFKHC